MVSLGGRIDEGGKGAVSWSFAEFVLYHAGCEGGMVEFRLDEETITCWCLLCGEGGVFAGTRKDEGLVGSAGSRRPAMGGGWQPAAGRGEAE